MKIIDCDQNSPEWFAARVGKATASEFSRIITPLGKESKAVDGYINEILAEMIVGHHIDGFQSDYMARGKELEDDAALLYATLTDDPVVKVGFCVSDCGRMGCSPDRLVGDHGLLETKVLKPGNHVAQLLKPELDDDHKPQLQGQLLVTGRQWVDVMSYHPEMKPVIIRVERDNAYLFDMTRYIEKFDKALKEKIDALTHKGHLKVAA